MRSMLEDLFEHISLFFHEGVYIRNDPPVFRKLSENIKVTHHRNLPRYIPNTTEQISVDTFCWCLLKRNFSWFLSLSPG
jgi:hypothetical protein